MVRSLFIIAVFNVFVFSHCFAQKGETSVYMTSGEVYRGELIAVGSSHVLIKYDEQIFSLDRSKVRYVFAQPKALRLKTNPETFVFKEFDKRFSTELVFGIYTFTPFNFSMAFTEWLKINEVWSAGLGVSLDFLELGMVKYNAHVRYYRPHNKNIRGYVDAQAGMSAGANPLAQNGPSFVEEVSPVFQSSLGAGIFFNTGFGAALTLEMGFSMFRYNLRETSGFGVGEVTSNSKMLNVGTYIQGGFMF